MRLNEEMPKMRGLVKLITIMVSALPKLCPPPSITHDFIEELLESHN